MIVNSQVAHRTLEVKKNSLDNQNKSLFQNLDNIIGSEKIDSVTKITKHSNSSKVSSLLHIIKQWYTQSVDWNLNTGNNSKCKSEEL